MENELRQRLQSYCDDLIGESTEKKKIIEDEYKKEQKATEKLPTHKSSLLSLDKKIKKTLENKEFLIDESSSSICDKKSDKNARYTDDGFKIIHSIPDDDSDLSDAFECEDDEEFNDSKLNTSTEIITSDGFKVVSHIPSDESGVSDAFESDIDDDDWLEEVKERNLNEQKFHDDNKSKNYSKDVKDTHCKALSKLIDEFDLDKYSIRKEEKKKLSSFKNQTLAARLNPPTNLTILDYSQSRGKKRKGSRKEVSSSNLTMAPESKTFMKKAKHEIYKLGISKFDKNKKKEAKIALAVSLGAEPPKKPCINYKIFQKQKIEEQQKLKEEKEVKRKMGMLVTKKPVRQEKKNSKKASQTGKLKDAILTVSKRDIQRINSS